MRITRLGLTAIAMAGVWLLATPGEASAQKRQRDRITREEIMASAQRETDVYQVIRSIRPHFLQPPKGTRSLGASYVAPVAVYVDDRKEPGLGALRTMSPSSVEEIRYLEPSASTGRYGPSANGGAVVIKLYKAPMVVPAAKVDSTRPR